MTTTVPTRSSSRSAPSFTRHGLIVRGSHGHSSLGNLVMGSVATKVLAGCSTPVLLIR